MRILFISSNRIGDAVLSTGLIAHLARGKDARFTIASGPASAPLFGAVPGLERMIVLRKNRYKTHWLSLWWQTVRTRWDLVVDLRRSALSYLVWTGQRAVLPPEPDHPVHRVRLIASSLGLEEAPPSPHIWTGKAHEKLAAELIPGGAVLALGPTANWGGKIWPPEKFAALAKSLTSEDSPLQGVKVAIFGGKDERLQAAPLLREIPRESRIDLVGKTDLLTTAACLKRCNLFIGNDSGLMHMAAACGIPTLGLFGPSREELYGPWGEYTASVRTPESFEDIVGNPSYDFRTSNTYMNSLSVETVEKAALELIAKAKLSANGRAGA